MKMSSLKKLAHSNEDREIGRWGDRNSSIKRLITARG
jgi:hypothetical protein